MKQVKSNIEKLLEFFSADINTSLELPLVDKGIKAGFPSPAQDFIDVSIDLNKYLVKNPSSTFYARVNGDSMNDFGINNGDLIIIDKSLEPTNNRIAVCFIDGEFTLKRILFEKDYCLLLPGNNNYKPIKVTRDNQFMIWGIAVHVIKNL